jgi:uncharacterized membrane protein (DUF2068 family)
MCGAAAVTSFCVIRSMGKRQARRSGPLGTGVRFVAIFEAAKGALILLAGCGALSLIHHDLQQLAEELVRHFHLDPASHYPRIFIEAADRVSDSRLWLLAALAFGYAAIHFVQGYGLWRKQRWAAWLAIAAAASYIPFEVYGLLHGVSKIKVSTLVVNIAIVLYMSYELWRSRRRVPTLPTPAKACVRQRTDASG